MFDQPPERATTLSLNYSILSNNSFRRKLSVIQFAGYTENE